METIGVRTTRRIELVDLTSRIQQAVAKSKIKQGICFVFVPHTTAGITINENADPSVKRDITNTLNKLIPEGMGYTHSEGNADSHIKSSLLGTSLHIFVEAGKLCLGAWQGIFFAESDGPRNRQVWVKVLEG
ncbi:MAG: secondary thiamine-phosphate synthase enzyme YjbQ [Candidatus Omnitrophota bacterium]|jgi:secondary thiamine-phosphate synthase enzyme